MSNMIIRDAEIDDLDWIIEELREFSKLFNTRIPIMGNEDYVRSYVLGLMTNELLLLAEDQGRRLGFIAGVLSRHQFNPEITVLHALAWWVIPSARGGVAAGRLLGGLRSYGEEHADWINVGIREGSCIGSRSLEGLGFFPIETQYIMEVT